MWRKTIEVKDMKELTKNEINDLLFTRDWTQSLLDKLTNAKTEDHTNGSVKDTLFQCASVCYQNKGMDEQIGKLETFEDFFSFLIEEWDWKFSYSRESNELICDENKSECICPVARTCNYDISPTMCYCTEGMLKRIFEKALHRNVDTTMITSILRGGKSCVYKIIIDGLSESEKDYLNSLA